ncbi:4-alpha-glucanotransferase [Methanolinea mesophila]|uniref:4-alpha-glucanotransferase n=1 Tax=Methanolinea mesophila TaxID=547055 RepID=UPI001AE5087B|nr:4-alpha-glucanotransferase [Methanolinea mesophila]
MLLHITSLPAPFGTGDLGPGAFRFVDLLYRTGVKVWQILPLNPTSLACGNSPYYSNSAFGSNTLLISPELLCTEGFLTRRELDQLPRFPEDEVEFSLVVPARERLLDIAAGRFPDLEDQGGYREFCAANRSWLDDHSLFVALKGLFPGVAWNGWPERIRYRDENTISRCREHLADRVEKEKILQYLFSRQWSSLKTYCNRNGILVMGDLPLYVTHDSADVWAHPGLFDLDLQGNARVVAGVPPDYFSRDGQLWGNPLYRWDVHKTQGYRWWGERMARAAGQYDLLRIDHFRGFSAYWEVDAGEETAAGGRWVPGPGADLFTALCRSHPGLPLVAEDLGVITPDVRDLMARFGIPGMRVLLFGFDTDPEENPNHPANVPAHCVVYTGTHDNNTVRGWFECDATREERQRLSGYLGREVGPEGVAEEFVVMALASRASLAMIPLQDLLGLRSGARMNVPGTTRGNWRWRAKGSDLDRGLAERLRRIIADHGRS